MKRKQILDRLATTWREFEESYAGLTDAQMLQPRVTGKWSVRDIIAHVTWWEEEALKHLPVIRAGGRSPRYSVTYGGIDGFNAMMTEQRSSFSLETVMRQHASVHTALMEYVRSSPEELFTRETRFRRRLRFDTYGHYPIHTEAILNWRRAANSA